MGCNTSRSRPNPANSQVARNPVYTYGRYEKRPGQPGYVAYPQNGQNVAPSALYGQPMQTSYVQGGQPWGVAAPGAMAPQAYTQSFLNPTYQQPQGYIVQTTEIPVQTALTNSYVHTTTQPTSYIR